MFFVFFGVCLVFCVFFVAGLALDGVDFEGEEGILGVAGNVGSVLKKFFRAFKP